MRSLSAKEACLRGQCSPVIWSNHNWDYGSGTQRGTVGFGTETEGDLNVVVVAWTGDNISVSSISDSEGNTYAMAASPVLAGSLNQVIYVSGNIRARQPNVATVVMSGAPQLLVLRTYELAGVVAPTQTAAESSCRGGLELNPLVDEVLFAACLNCPPAAGFGLSPVVAGRFPIVTSSSASPLPFLDGLGFIRSSYGADIAPGFGPGPCVVQFVAFSP
jgi:hypothetical protein